jgi:hypothetical protein
MKVRRQEDKPPHIGTSFRGEQREIYAVIKVIKWLSIFYMLFMLYQSTIILGTHTFGLPIF